MQDMYQLPHVVNTIIWKAEQDKICNLTSLKLQKLLYFIYMEYLSTMDTPLFSERFECWPRGPVVADAYYGCAKNIVDGCVVGFMVDAQGLKRRLTLDEDSDFLGPFLRAWKKYSQVDGKTLSQETHRENSAWDKAKKKNEFLLNDQDIKEEAMMRENL